MPLHRNALRLAALLAAGGLVSTVPIPGMAQLSVAQADTAGTHRHGEIRRMGTPKAWDGDVEAWVTPEQFWLNYAERRGGLTWGRGKRYPRYDDVKEGDLFLVEVKSGPCLMEFFHSRWRRANDVRRWDPGFNEYGGCADVFK
jgi:hypothetical protein